MVPALFAKLSASLNPFVVILYIFIILENHNYINYHYSRISIFFYMLGKYTKKKYSLNHPKIWREIVRRFHCSSVDNVSFDNGDNTAGLASDARSRFIPRNNRRDVQNSRTQNSQNSGGIPLVSFTNQRMLNNRMDSCSSGQSFGPDVMATNLPHSRSEQYFSSYSSDFRRPPTRPRLTLNLTKSRKTQRLSNTNR